MPMIWDTIEGHEIVVRRAGKTARLFATLASGEERTLDERRSDATGDGRKAVGIAGIMGGENSMITDNVHTVLFEAACFNGTNIASFFQENRTSYRCIWKI